MKYIIYHKFVFKSKIFSKKYIFSYILNLKIQNKYLF